MVRRRAIDGHETYWADRLDELEVTSVLGIEAGPPFLGPVAGLSGAALVLLAVTRTFEVPNTWPFLVASIALCASSLLVGDFGVRRVVASRWTAVIGAPAPMSMLIGVVGDRLVIWRWPRRGKPAPRRLVVVALAEVTLRRRFSCLGGLEIGLPRGDSLLVHHDLGPHEQEELARILSAVAAARPS